MRDYIIHYTLKNIKYNKKKYVSLFIGITLATILLTSIYLIIYNINIKEIDDAKNTHGDYHFSFVNTDINNADILTKDNQVDKNSISVVQFQTGKTFNEFPNLKVDIVSFDDNAFKFMWPLKIIEGRMPSNSSEIIIEEWISRRNIGTVKIGDKINTVINGKDESYTVVGYYENFRTSQYTQKVNFYTYLDKSKVKNEGNLITNIYFKLKSGISIKNNFSTYRNIVGEEHFQANDSLLYLLGEHEKSTNSYFDSTNLLLILPIVIITVTMIYNSLSISVIERVKQLGLLRMVGASKKHVRYIMMCEMFFINIVAIPSGIILSIIGLKLIIPVLNFKYIIGDGIQTSFISIIKSMLIIFVTSILTAYFPAKAAIKLSPINAALGRWNKERDKNSKNTAKKLYSLEVDLANRNIKRNKSRYRGTLLSVTISVILVISSISLSSMINSILNVAGEDLKLNYSIYKGTDTPNQQFINEYDDLGSIEQIDKLYKKYDVLLGYSYIQSSSLNDKYREYSGKDIGSGLVDINTSFYIYDNERLENSCMENYLIRGNVDINKMQNENEVLIIQKNKVKNEKNEKYYDGNTTNLNIGDTIKVKLNTSSDKIAEVKVAGIISASPFNMKNEYDDVANNNLKNFQPEMKIVISDKLVEKLINGLGENENYNKYLNLIGYDVMLRKDEDTSLASKQIAYSTNQIPDLKLIENQESIDKRRATLSEVSLISYVFVGILCLIGILNLFNTCSANVILRKHEIAMLKAIGMTKKQVRKVINFEGIIFGLKGGILGVAISMIFVYSFYYFIKSIEFFKWNMAMSIPIITFLLTIIMGYAATIRPLAKVNNANIIDEIKSQV